MASLGWGLPSTVSSLCLPFCFSGYIVHLRCTSDGGSLVSVCCPAVLLSLLSGLYRVHGLRIYIQPLSRCSLTFPASPFFSESVCRCCRCFVSSLFYSTIRFSFLSLAYKLANSYPLLVCLIRAAILNLSFPFSSAFVYILILCHR